MILEKVNEVEFSDKMVYRKNYAWHGLIDESRNIMITIFKRKLLTGLESGETVR